MLEHRPPVAEEQEMEHRPLVEEQDKPVAEDKGKGQLVAEDHGVDKVVVVVFP